MKEWIKCGSGHAFWRAMLITFIVGVIVGLIALGAWLIDIHHVVAGGAILAVTFILVLTSILFYLDN